LSKTNRLTLLFEKSRLFQIRDFEVYLLALLFLTEAARLHRAILQIPLGLFLLLLMGRIKQGFVKTPTKCKKKKKTQHIKLCSWSM